MEKTMSSTEFVCVEKSVKLSGEVKISGAKNAVLVIMASLILTKGKSVLSNVPNSDDVLCMIKLLSDLGAQIVFDTQNNILHVDTSYINNFTVKPEIMRKIRASILVLGPLLARFGQAKVALPGGDMIGSRPIDYHVKNLQKMGAVFTFESDFVYATVKKLESRRLILDYPSVGATENIMMAAVLTEGVTEIVNAAIEPEVLDLISVLCKMGAKIEILPPATIKIIGVNNLNPIEHEIIFDRLEAGSILLATAITGGSVYLPDARADMMDVFLLKLCDMGHKIETGNNYKGIKLTATDFPQAVSFVTGPYPQFPTDLQAPMMAVLTLAHGTSEIHETVYENRLLHAHELQKMGANIKIEGDKAIIKGVSELYGAQLNARDIRAACALVIAGLAANSKSVINGVHHLLRGYDMLDKKLSSLGANIEIKSLEHISADFAMEDLIRHKQV